MPKDAPDFSVGTIDLPSLVINTMPLLKNYPGGSVFYFDNFEGPNITWEILKELGVDHCFAEIDKTHAYIGTGCVRLYRNVNKPICIRLDRQFQFRSSDTIGVEFSYMLSDTNYDKADFVYEYKIDDILYQFFIEFTDYDIIIHSSEGDHYLPYNFGDNNRKMAWNNVKVIINTKNHRFVRLYYGKTVYNIDYPSETFSEEGDEGPRLRIGFYSIVFGVAQKSMWIDKVILTDDETI